MVAWARGVNANCTWARDSGLSVLRNASAPTTKACVGDADGVCALIDEGPAEAAVMVMAAPTATAEMSL
jgi:hypothetical protein